MLLLFLLSACSNDDKSVTSDSGVSLYHLGLSAVYGGDSLPADGSSKASILVEVWDSAGNYVSGASVSLSSSMGSIAASSLTTANGIANTTFTAGKKPGAAYVNATMENATASVKIPLSYFGEEISQ